MIVAASARDACSQERPPQIVDRVFERQKMLTFAVAAKSSGNGQITCGGDAFKPFGVGSTGDQIASNLLAQELVVA